MSVIDKFSNWSRAPPGGCLEFKRSTPPYSAHQPKPVHTGGVGAMCVTDGVMGTKGRSGNKGSMRMGST